MHILAAILMFVFGSIGAALDGDYFGVKAIGKFFSVRSWNHIFIMGNDKLGVTGFSDIDFDCSFCSSK